MVQTHLCDCHFEDGLDIVEVGLLARGNDITTFDLFGVKCGVAICYDAYFDEFIKLYGLAGRNLCMQFASNFRKTISVN